MIATGLSRLALLLFALVASAATAQGTRELRGNTPSGASFVIAVPPGWAPGGPLVFVNHGFAFDIDRDPDLGPLREVQLAEGYALAASGYRQRGWVLFTALDDNAELLQRFRSEFGDPGSIIAAGGSMGGLIALKQAEDARFPNLLGVYSLCPPASGAYSWDAALDLRLSYDAICRDVGGGELPRGSEPYPWALDLADIPPDLSDLSLDSPVTRALVRVTQCTGLLLPPALRTSAQRGRLEALREVSGISSEDFLTLNLAYAIYALSDLVRSPDKLGNQSPFDTRGVIYGNTTVDNRVPRLAPIVLAAYDFERSSSLGGRTSARVLSMHTSKDQLVVPGHQEVVRARYPVAQRVSLIALESEATHCRFNPAELLGGWESLRSWIAGGNTPTATDVQSRCTGLVSAATPGPCRLTDSASVALAPLAVTQRPRPQRSKAEASARRPGLWFPPGRSGEGLLLEARSGDRVTASWYTYPAPGLNARQLWLFGEARIDAIGYRSDYLIRTEGTSFGNGFDPTALRRIAAGSLDIAFDGDDDAVLRFNGAPGVAPFSTPLTRLTVPRHSPPASAIEGAWADPARAGEGVFLHFAAGASEGAEAPVLLWYTYDLERGPMWLIGDLAGTATETANPCPPAPAFCSVTRYRFRLLRGLGAQFGADFDARAVRLEPWGEADFSARSCAAATLDYRALDPAFGRGRLSFARFTVPAGASCAP